MKIKSNRKFRVLSLPVALAVLCGLGGTCPAFSQSWTPLSAAPSAFAVSSSADGSKVIAAGGDNNVRVSTNSGASWTGYLGNSTVVAVSADGNTLFASSGQLYASTNWGTSWSQLTNLPNYGGVSGAQFICCSGDGSKVLVAHGSGLYEANSLSGPLYSSFDSGYTWTTNNVPLAKWQCAAMSADGSKLFAAIAGGGLFASANFGQTWTSNATPNNSVIVAIAASADATKLAAASYSGNLYTSTSFGASWLANNAPNLSWGSIASSADGHKLAATVGAFEGASGGIYSSTNGGSTWVPNTAPVRNWTTVACSADGCRQFAAGYDGDKIYSVTLTTAPPLLQLANLGNAMMLSWPVTSTKVALQQSSNLVDWAIFPSVAALNVTNLNSQAMIQASNGGAFFRLQTQ